MDLSNITIVPKISSYDYCQTQYKLSGNEVVQRWRSEGMTDDEVIRSLEAHENHHRSITTLRTVFSNKLFVARDIFNRDRAQQSSLVIALGGDDHFQYVSHFLDSSVPIMGVNSDPIRSDGNMLPFIAQDVVDALPSLQEDKFITQHWTRLSALIHAGGNKTIAIPATSQYAIVSEDPEGMTRYTLDFNGKSEHHRGSGLLVATGAGSTGWFRGAVKYLTRNHYRFGQTEPVARFALREPFEKEEVPQGKATTYEMAEGIIRAGEQLNITYGSHGEGRLGVDAQVRYPLQKGNTILIRLSDTPLRVVQKLS